MGDISSEQITVLLKKWSEGDETALSQLTPLIYADLRKLAAHFMRGERPNHTLQPTALANEAYLRLAESDKLIWQNRGHFFAVAADAMRHVLIDHARNRGRKKRGGDVIFLPLDEALAFTPEASSSLLALDDALNTLVKIEPRKTRVVELRYFGGLTVNEIAGILQISPNTVTRDWNWSEAWLRRELSHDRKRRGKAEKS